MKYLAACTVIVGCVMLANPAFAGDTRIFINADLGLFGNVHDRYYDRHNRYYDHRFDRRYDRRHDRTIIIHRAPRVIYSPFGSFRHGFWDDHRGRGHDKHWKGNDRRHDRHDNRRYRDDHRDRRRH